MGMVGIDDPATDKPIDLRHDIIKEAEAQVDASVYALAAQFGAVSFPPDMPDHVKDAIMDRAAREREAAGDFVIDNRMNPNDPRARQEKQDEENFSQMTQFLMQQQQERDEWARTSSTVGGVTMTGSDWSKLATKLRNDEELRRKVTAAFKARGMSDEEAQARYDRVADVAEIAAIPPSQRTDAQKETIRDANADPAFKQDMETVQSFARNSEVARPKSQLNEQFAQASTGENIPTANPPSMPTVSVRPETTVTGMGF